MKTRLLFLFTFLFVMARAQNIEVQGLQSGIWLADTVFVTGDVQVEESLTIASGTKVVFNGFYGIRVRGGSVIAVGTEEDPIVFTVTDTTGFHVYNSGCGGWNGLSLLNAQKARFDHCLFQYGKAADTLRQHGGALEIINCKDVEITNSTLRCNFAREHGGGLNAEHSMVKMNGCKVVGNKLYTSDPLYYMYGGGLRFLNCDVEMTDMQFLNNFGEISIGGGLSLDSCSVKLDRAVFEDNHAVNGGGLYIMRCNDKSCSISNCLFDHNHSTHFGGGLAISNASPEISNITVTNNTSEGVDCGGVFIYEQSCPVMRNIIVCGNHTSSAFTSGSQQFWLWTYEDAGPSFYNGLISGGLDSINGSDNIKVFEAMMDANPLFADPDSRDYRLSADSPCIDAGDLATDPLVLEGLDLQGMPRVSNGRVDMGAYEFSSDAVVENESANHTIHFVGNPLKGDSYAEVVLNKPGNAKMMVYALNGAMVWTESIGDLAAGTQRVGLGDLYDALVGGVYFVEIRTEEETFIGKVVRP